jgi:hypothetical protein
MSMKTMTSSVPNIAAFQPLRIESSPSEAPTSRVSATFTGAGSAPARSTIARSRALWAVSCRR